MSWLDPHAKRRATESNFDSTSDSSPSPTSTHGPDSPTEPVPSPPQPAPAQPEPSSPQPCAAQALPVPLPLASPSPSPRSSLLPRASPSTRPSTARGGKRKLDDVDIMKRLELLDQRWEELEKQRSALNDCTAFGMLVVDMVGRIPQAERSSSFVQVINLLQGILDKPTAAPKDRE
ncbi:circumsporozoite protein-like [Engraulis encrasicolus]|uniref:circumsporozoite protein-like n=1 Tax=Engraulis encrasicolus TaxID=184585 RepID=UPI002FD6DFC7